MFSKTEPMSLDNKLSIDENLNLILQLTHILIPNSSTRESLKPDGYPELGEIEQTIRRYQKEGTKYEQALKAIETGCGNCQDMAYACAVLLRIFNFKGNISITSFGINHMFLRVNDYILDAWAEKFFPFEEWKKELKAYGGSIKNGIMRGRLLDASHFELEDEEPELHENVPREIIECLPNERARAEIKTFILKAIEKQENDLINTNEAALQAQFFR